MDIVLIGAQGSGKGTQSEKLAQSLGICRVASGDLFREELNKKTELGQRAGDYLKRGELVPDDITVPMVLKRIRGTDCVSGVLLDGFPRTIAQAQALDEGLQEIERSITCALYLKVPRETLLRRLSGRYICRAHQHVYNVNTNPPRVPGICDVDGSELYQRPDDRGEAVQKRLDIFFSETIRLLDYYHATGKLVEVNGDQGIEQVQRSLMQAVKSR
ncbi:MAG TPA: adenylate kinase [Ktedonobacteraceae bacterium]|nr:adenylate kinase [Ktedonobacteraceae bacterium]